MQQQCLAALQSAALEHIVPDGEESFWNGAGFRHRKIARNPQGMALMRQAIFGITAADHQRHDLVARGPAGDVVAQRHDLAGNFEAGNIRCALGRRIKPAALHDVGTVHACGCDLDQNFAGSGLRDRTFFGNQAYRAAGRGDGDGGHVGRKWVHARFLVACATCDNRRRGR
jgi:hypothetical protein